MSMLLKRSCYYYFVEFTDFTYSTDYYMNDILTI